MIVRHFVENHAHALPEAFERQDRNLETFPPRLDYRPGILVRTLYNEERAGM